MQAPLHGLGVGAKGAVVQRCVGRREHEMGVTHGTAKGASRRDGKYCICHCPPMIASSYQDSGNFYQAGRDPHSLMVYS